MNPTVGPTYQRPGCSHRHPHRLVPRPPDRPDSGSASDPLTTSVNGEISPINSLLTPTRGPARCTVEVMRDNPFSFQGKRGWTPFCGGCFRMVGTRVSLRIFRFSDPKKSASRTCVRSSGRGTGSVKPRSEVFCNPFGVDRNSGLELPNPRGKKSGRGTEKTGTRVFS